MAAAANVYRHWVEQRESLRRCLSREEAAVSLGFFLDKKHMRRGF
jgi:hypothetical protein